MTMLPSLREAVTSDRYTAADTARALRALRTLRPYTCAVCGTMFEDIAAPMPYGNRYCSIVCRRRARYLRQVSKRQATSQK